MYQVRINTQRPGCLIVLVDQSGLMNHRVAGVTIQKRMAAADAVNGLIYEACLFSTRDTGVSHRFDIGVIGYGVGEEGIQSLFGKDLAPINEIAELAKPPQPRFAHPFGGHDSVQYQAMKLPIWLEPVAEGRTMMRAAFERGLAIAKTWIRQHPTSFPPIVINITGGSFAGMSPAPLVSEIRKLTTQDGNTLVFNCHISDTEDMTIMYPGPSSAVSFKGRKRQLYEMSSVLPEQMRETARYRGYDLDLGARSYVLNGDIASIFNFLETGTRAVLDL